MWKSPERPEWPLQQQQSPDGTQPPQPAVPALNAEVTLLLKYLSNIWRFLDLPLTNCETEPDLLWEDGVLW